ncbi:MAG: hypothetical protein CDV28_1422 [Candidatus Electronema aureum]|uniref:Uncharacterized protein n=1 Tax=Candidatus Electronema aureum TaxID=2005002 RepID=A0A521FZ45_9BACT|nr:MAG: hypothetical protein CDV28_1422 [Candidatus Electronema aureum]
MATLQWRPAVNALTKPVSCRIQIIPRNIAGFADSAVSSLLLRQCRGNGEP